MWRGKRGKKVWAVSPRSTLLILAGLVLLGSWLFVRSPRFGQLAAPARQTEEQLETLAAPAREAKALLHLQRVDWGVSEIERLAAKQDWDDVAEESQENRHEIEKVLDDVLELRTAQRDTTNLVNQARQLLTAQAKVLIAAAQGAIGDEKKLIEIELRLTEALQRQL